MIPAPSDREPAPRFFYNSSANREIVRVHPDGTMQIAENATLGELRYALEQMAKFLPAPAPEVETRPAGQPLHLVAPQTAIGAEDDGYDLLRLRVTDADLPFTAECRALLDRLLRDNFTRVVNEHHPNIGDEIAKVAKAAASSAPAEPRSKLTEKALRLAVRVLHDERLQADDDLHMLAADVEALANDRLASAPAETTRDEPLVGRLTAFEVKATTVRLTFDVCREELSKRQWTTGSAVALSLLTLGVYETPVGDAEFLSTLADMLSLMPFPQQRADVVPRLRTLAKRASPSPGRSAE